jgi:hypothetical protein
VHLGLGVQNGFNAKENNMGDTVMNWAAGFKLSLGSEFYGNGISADKHPGLDGTVSPYLNQPLTKTDPSFKLKIKYVPIQFGTKLFKGNFGIEGIYGMSPTSASKSMEEDSGRPGYLHSPGIGVTVGSDIILDSGLSFGADLSLGYRYFMANDVSLGGYSSKTDLSLHTGYVGVEGSIGWKGVRAYLGVDMLFGHYKRFEGMTEADHGQYRYGIGNINSDVNAIVSAGIVFSLPGFGVGE